MGEVFGGEFVPALAGEMGAEKLAVVAFAVIGNRPVEGFGREGGQEGLVEVVGGVHVNG